MQGLECHPANMYSAGPTLAIVSSGRCVLAPHIVFVVLDQDKAPCAADVHYMCMCMQMLKLKYMNAKFKI